MQKKTDFRAKDDSRTAINSIRDLGWCFFASFLHALSGIKPECRSQFSQSLCNQRPHRVSTGYLHTWKVRS